jgi:hypothetical protein
MTLKNKIELFIKKYDDKLHIKKITALEGTNHNVVYVEFKKQNIQNLVSRLEDYNSDSDFLKSDNSFLTGDGFDIELDTNVIDTEEAYCVYRFAIPFCYTLDAEVEEEKQIRFNEETIVYLISRNYKNIYHNYLNTKEWFDKRNLALEYADYKCCRCSKKENLQIHHLNYNNIGNEYVGDLEVVCSSCHKKIHKINKQSNYVI